MKKCTKCGIVKILDDFPVNKQYKNNRHSKCKICINLINKLYRDLNSDKVKLSRKLYYNKNIDKMRETKRADVKKYKQSKILYDKIYRQKNKKHIAELKKEWELKHKDDPIFKIKRNLRRRIHHVIKNNYKSESTFKLIGCTAEQFKLYIELLFLDGMSWDNYSINGWHIDHIKPCYSFDLSDPEQQKQCFHFSNQRPLWAKDNLRRPRSD